MRGRLILLSLALIILALLAAALFVADAFREQRRSVERQIGETARALSLVVDREVGQRRLLAETLALSPALKAESWSEFDALARAAARGHEAWVVVSDSKGQQLVNTRAPVGQPLPLMLARPTNLWAGTLPGGSRLSNLFMGPLVKRPVIVVSLEVPRRGGGRA
ncbi:hypothetical protein BH11PSE2_BH11PSE2_09460 [soil metagenome]